MPSVPHHRVHPGRASGGRAPDRLEQLVGGAVVGIDQHPPQEGCEPRSGCGNPAQAAQELDGDRELQRRGGRKPGARVPGCSGACSQVLDEDAADTREAAREAAHACARAPGPRNRAAAGSGRRRARPLAAARTPARRSSRSAARSASTAVTRSVTSALRQRHDEDEPPPEHVLRHKQAAVDAAPAPGACRAQRGPRPDRRRLHAEPARRSPAEGAPRTPTSAARSPGEARARRGPRR